MNFKRRRPPTSRGAMCLCHGMDKKLHPNKLNGPAHNAREMRLRANARLEDADDLSTDPCRNGTCRECAEALTA